MTKVWSTQNVTEEVRKQMLVEAANLIVQGKIIAFPTETVYGLGADATNDLAIQKIFYAKGRPSDNPLIVHIANYSQLEHIVEYIPDLYQPIIQQLWPGPITLIFPVKPGILSPTVTAGMNTVGIRMPSHPISTQFIELAKCPIAAPSANLSGRPSPTTGQHVFEDLAGKIDGIIDDGATGVGIESTVILSDNEQIHILRPGAVTYDKLCELLPNVNIMLSYEQALGNQEVPMAPGMKYKHYAPRGYLQIVKSNSKKQVQSHISKKIEIARQKGEKTGVMTFEDSVELYQADLVLSYGNISELNSVAQQLYAVLRKFDEEEITHIFVESCPEDGVGAAVMNRLRKAASEPIVDLDKI